MQQIINTKEMKLALKDLNDFTSTKNTISILSCFGMKNGFIYCFNTNDNTVVKRKVDIQESKFVYNISRFKTILENIKTVDFELIENEENQYIISGKRKVDLKAYSIEKFPTAENNVLSDFIDYDKTENTTLIFKNEFELLFNTLSENASRRFTNAIFIEYKDEKMNVVSTDGKQMTVITNDKISGNFYFDDDFTSSLVKATNFKKMKSKIKGGIIINFIDKEFKQVEIIVNPNLIIIQDTDKESNFPPYEKVLPEYTNYIEINKKEFLEELKFMSKMIDKETNKIQLDFYTTHINNSSSVDQLKLSYEDIVNGDGSTLLEKVYFFGFNNEIKIHANCQFLLNVVSLLEKDTIRLYLDDIDPKTRALQILQDSINYIVMPMVK